MVREPSSLELVIDTCSNANVMPASIHKILYNDPDCPKLLPSNKNGIKPYTNQKIPVIGSCELFVLHQDDKCFHKVKFQVVDVEGSVIIHNLMCHKHQSKSYTD